MHKITCIQPRVHNLHKTNAFAKTENCNTFSAFSAKWQKRMLSMVMAEEMHGYYKLLKIRNGIPKKPLATHIRE